MCRRCLQIDPRHSFFLEFSYFSQHFSKYKMSPVKARLIGKRDHIDLCHWKSRVICMWKRPEQLTCAQKNWHVSMELSYKLIHLYFSFFFSVSHLKRTTILGCSNRWRRPERRNAANSIVPRRRPWKTKTTTIVWQLLATLSVKTHKRLKQPKKILNISRPNHFLLLFLSL